MTEIRAEELVKIHNEGRPDETRALHGVSLAVDPGEVVAFRGPSGSGKTTLLSLLGCMARPTSGKVFVNGKNVAKLPERFLAQEHRRSFGFIFQQFHLIREVSVLENVVLPLYPTRLGFAEMRRTAQTVLEELGLSERARVKAKHLSGGEQQRVAVARALVGNPGVLIADEPTAHLDEALSTELLALLSRIASEGRTLLIATHDPLVYDHPLVNRTFDLRNGRITGEAKR